MLMLSTCPPLDIWSCSIKISILVVMEAAIFSSLGGFLFGVNGINHPWVLALVDPLLCHTSFKVGIDGHPVSLTSSSPRLAL